MSQPKSNLRLGDLQLRILQELWTHCEATVAAVHAAINAERPLAYTTIATMLRKMEQRRLVQHREDGRAFIYRPLVRSEDVNQNATRHLLDRVFEGSLTGALNHLLQTREVSRDELDELGKLITQAKRKAK